MKPEILKGINSEYLFFPDKEETILSAGKFSTTYLGADSSAKRVIIKQLNPRLAEDDQARYRFLVEAGIRIKHPAIVRAIDLIKTRDTYFIIQEYIHGTDLKTLIKRGDFKHNSLLACRLLIPLLDAIAAIHRKNIIHRDIKPSNILVAYKPGTGDIDWHHPDVKLIDFGLSKTNDGIPLFPGSKKRHPFPILYAAPEVVLNREDLTDERSDLYSLALVMMEMFTSQPVFYADNPAAIITRQISDMPRRPAKMYPRFYEIFRKAAAKQKFHISPSKLPPERITEILKDGLNERYDSAEAMHQDLMQFMRKPGEMPKGFFQRIFK
ncbi:MAG: serine/threonine protein kinase [Bacteroidales bacterium]